MEQSEIILPIYEKQLKGDTYEIDQKTRVRNAAVAVAGPIEPDL